MDQQQLIINKACLNCPRCNSTNTKFCYYNNYSLSQPRHFCKACKRYWTRGGTLRNVPVGGGCRKNNKRVKIRVPTPSSSTSLITSSNQVSQITTSTVSTTIQEGNNDVLISPLLFSSYKNMMNHQQEQQCNIFSEMNVVNNNDNSTNGSLLSRFNNSIVEYHSLQNATPTSCTSLNQVDQLLERMFPFQTMQQQELSQLTSTTVNGHHHSMRDQQQQQQEEEQRWRNTNHDLHSTSMYKTSQWP